MNAAVDMGAVNSVMDLIFGRWRSQVLYAATELDIFDHLDRLNPKSSRRLAEELNLDLGLLYRLMRALSAIQLLREVTRDEFVLTAGGETLRADHPRSLKHMALLEEGPEHYAIWKHLTEMVRDGRQNGFMREYGAMAFDYAAKHSAYRTVFKQAMSSFSGVQSAMALEALEGYDFSRFRTVCDVAGGQGHMLCSFLRAHPHLSGIVFDLPDVIANTDDLWATKLGLGDRCQHIGGDMFETVPAADAYTLKMILHDWNDDECVRVLRNMRERVHGVGRVFIVEHVVPGNGEPHFSKLYDVHMMCWGSGRERTEVEYAELLSRAGWQMETAHYPANRMMGVIEGIAT